MTSRKSKTVADADLSTKPAQIANGEMFYVGIGASAGGLEALRLLVTNLPPQDNVTYVLAQHMSPDHRSMMVELLERETSLKVEAATHNVLPRANVIYVAPPNTDIAIRNGKITLGKPSNMIGPKPSVDLLFLSLAQDREEKCIAIVLSGTGTDGARGIKAVKAAGGMTIAQDPTSAKYDSMPNAAVRIGGADFVLTPQEIASKLPSLINSFPNHPANMQTKELPLSIQAGIIKDIATQTGMDFSSYKEATIARQVARRMAARQIASIEKYGEYLKGHRDEVTDLANSFLICVTSFFRDPEAFEALRKLLQEMMTRKKQGDDIRIWVPGCATGEEVYSIALLLSEICGQDISSYKVQIFATDINVEALQIARAGMYPKSALSEMQDGLISRYFTEQNGTYTISKGIKSMVLFARQDLTQDPPFVRLDLVSCRNLLIYFKPELQDVVMKIFHYGLVTDGMLLLGKSESVGKNTALFAEVDRRNKIFAKRNTATPVLGSFGRVRNVGVYRLPSDVEKVKQNLHSTGIEQLSSIYVPPSMLVTQEGEVLEIFGDCSNFVSIRTGRADFNLFALVESGVRAQLRAYIHNVVKSKQTFYSMPLRKLQNGVEIAYRIAVHHVEERTRSDADLLLVSFEPWHSADAVSPTQILETDAEARISALESDLMVSREGLQTVIEELETANEELQSLNEEAQAANEELQASNEELETSNEEMQASNEELITVNDELNTRTAELAKSNDDLNNVLNSLNKALVLVNENLFVTRFNPLALNFFDIPAGVSVNDLPVNLATLRTRYPMPDLLRHVQEVLHFGREVNYAFQDGEHSFFVMRLNPYVQHSPAGNTVVGVLLTIYDVTQERLSARALEKALAESEDLYQHAPVGYHSLSPEGVFLRVNDTELAWLGYRREELVGQCNVRSLLTAESQQRFDENFPRFLREGYISELELDMICKDGGIFPGTISATLLRDEAGRPVMSRSSLYDLRERKNSEQQLREKNQMLQDMEARQRELLEGLDVAVLVYDQSQRIVMINASARALLGLGAEQALAGQRFGLDWVWVNEDWQVLNWGHDVLAPAFEQGVSVQQRVLGLQRPSESEPRWLMTSVLPEFSLSEQVKQVVVTLFDVTARKEAEDRWKFALEGSGDGIWEVNFVNGRMKFSPRYRSMLGYVEGDLSPMYADWLGYIHADDAERTLHVLNSYLTGLSPEYAAEYRVRCKDGSYKWVLARGLITRRARDGRPLRMVGTNTDISRMKNAEMEAWKQANFDALSGLPNRRLFMDRLAQVLKKAARHQSKAALLFVDLDHFKEVNDTLGHDVGDLLLMDAARRIQNCLRDCDSVARLGGDEFTVILHEPHSMLDISRVADKILTTLADPYQPQGHVIYLSASIGVALYPEDALESSDLIKRADQAMYAAKTDGRNRYRFFESSMQENVTRHLRLSNDLRLALNNGHLQVHYQPIVSLQDGSIHKAEALLRWQHPDMGSVSPMTFIPIAEELGLIHDIGKMVWHEAARQAAVWTKLSGQPFQVSVNQSPMQFSQDLYPFHEWAQAAGAEQGAVIVEVTESVVMNNTTNVSGHLAALRDAGIEVAIDDFGTGYSSLAYLKKFHVDYLKIDQSFVQHLGDSVQDHVLCEAIVAMAHKLDIKVIAEGVESDAQRRLLAQMGCDYAQGSLFSRAIPAPELTALIEAQVAI